MRNTFMDTVMDSCKEREDVFLISGDAGLGVFDEFSRDYPDKFLNLGVAEQNMASFAAGLSLTGTKVYTYNIIPFALYRCYEQVRNDICYQKAPVVIVGIGSGLTYAPQGMTHYSIEDIALARTLPNLTVISPIDPVEARLAARYSLTADGPVYVRLAKRGEPRIHEKDDFDITLPQKIAGGEDAAILFHGSISAEVMAAYRELTAEDIHPVLVSVPMIQPLNTQALLGLLEEVKYVVCVEEHYEISGLGNILTCMHAESRPSWQLKTMGIPSGFIHEVKDQAGMREHFGISSGDIVKTVQGLLEKKHE